ncbi:MAG: hypothetical protein JJU33_01735 [Phycisphaerales bacterium]|nr:hypothetical protein [Phycisphaerales bacterium]
MRPITPAVLLLAACFLFTPAAAAQSDDELTRLRRIVAEQREELAQKDQRIRDLEARVEALRAELAEARRAAPRDDDAPDAAQTGAEARGPSDSPAGLLAALRDRYRIDLTDIDPDAELDDRARAALDARIRRWCLQMNRDLRTQISWSVRFGPVKEAGRGVYQASMTVIDPEDGRSIGEPVTIDIPRRFLSRLRDRTDRYDHWKLDGVLRPEPRLNAERVTTGVFSTTPLVGPFVDFDFSIEWSSLAGVAEPDPAWGETRDREEDAPRRR